ncbi:putative pectate lyase E [Hypsizygus marmoreus]|uniref:Pectate lyase n=1 Tax=Hypsizygus marmoreus TaxID=39966 RepID=A0A369K2K2_HYPMA|nr:putative pectate lyase E [Hypsizygus marmoreus]
MFALKTAIWVTLALSFASFVLADVPAYGQCGGNNWTGETAWWYSQCLPGTAAPTSTSTKTTYSTTKSSTSTTTTKAPTTTAAPPSGITTTLPASAGYTALPTASVISGSFDGKMLKYDRKGSSGACQEQDETGEADAVFILEAGASISNVIIGKDQAEGIHCRGPCTVTNVWWEDVCEDAITIKQTGSGDVSTINGGGAFSAEDKIVQHNGAGRVVIKNFFASTFASFPFNYAGQCPQLFHAGKLYRACGNCSKSYERHVTIDNVCLKGGSEGVGINTNWGDTAALSNVKTSGKPSGANVCCTYKGVASGSEPSKIGCGDSYSACQYAASSVGTC